MSKSLPISDRFLPLLNDVCDGVLIETETEELAAVLDSDEAARKVFIDHLLLQADIRFLGRAEKLCSVGLAGIQAILPPSPPTSPGFRAFPLFATTLHSTVGYFSSGWPVAYLVATVVLGLGVLIGAFTHVSQPVQFATQPTPLPTPSSTTRSTVGRITGMVDCQWESSADPKSKIQNPKSLVSLGDHFALSSGLMEITYNTGAKVILQGPVTYESELNGGFLSLGKLTGKLEKKPNSPRPSDGRGAGGEGGESSSHPSSFIPHPLFAVRTPTAIVTDLGTEFGVEVTKEGNTVSRVFRGSVRVQMLGGDGNAEGPGQVLHENESARVEHADNPGDDNGITVVGTAAKQTEFVCAIPKRIVKTLNLVDVVAGGDGFSHNCDRGIDANTGRTSDVQLGPVDTQGDYKYHRVEEMPFVDGVFIPDGTRGPVQIDSAGHTFPDCPNTDNRSHAYVWTGGKLPWNIATRIPTVIGGVDYSSSDHSLLLVHANKGITFNLDAIRQGNPDYKVVRFRAVAGNAENRSEKGQVVSADIWVLVDGQVRFIRRGFNNYNGAASIVIPIHTNDRFLTLVATDGGNSYVCDQIIFGDPRLELAR